MWTTRYLLVSGAGRARLGHRGHERFRKLDLTLGWGGAVERYSMVSGMVLSERQRANPTFALPSPWDQQRSKYEGKGEKQGHWWMEAKGPRTEQPDSRTLR